MQFAMFAVVGGGTPPKIRALGLCQLKRDRSRSPGIRDRPQTPWDPVSLGLTSGLLGHVINPSSATL